VSDLETFELERCDPEAAREARAFADLHFLDSALLHASFACGPLAARSRHRGVRHGGRLVGLAACTEGVFGYRSVPFEAALPGAPRALMERLERPFKVLARERFWSELERAGAKPARSRTRLQMTRFVPVALPLPDPRVREVREVAELRALLPERFGPLQLEIGPFVGIRDAAGVLVCAGGVELVTPKVAQIAYVETREDHRRRGLARAVVIELIRRLERAERRVILQVKEDNAPALALYAGLGFRAGRRLGSYWFE
jgi:ribosomal protein S18 acetylase RimI-like enzyme